MNGAQAMPGRRKALMAGLAAAAALAAPQDATAANRARDGKIAVTEEFEAARKAGTREALRTVSGAPARQRSR
jgi:hypothetical protein